MEITVYYRSGKIDAFTPNMFCRSEPFNAKGANLMTEWLLRIDRLPQDGLVLELYWYDGDNDDSQHDPGRAQRRPGRSFLLVSPEELPELMRIELDGTAIAWRQGREIVNGVKFAGQEFLFGGSERGACATSRMSSVFTTLRAMHEDWDDGRVAESMGCTMQAVGYAKAAEALEAYDEGGEE